MLEQGGTDERAQESADDVAEDRHGSANDDADQAADQSAPAGATRAAETLGELEAEECLQHFAQTGEEDDGDEGRPADAIKAAKRGKAEQGQHHEPETR